MRTLTRAALVVASFSCLLGAATVAVPSFAAEGTASTGTATAMLAAVTAPLLAVDVNALQDRDQDFSTAGRDNGSPITPQADGDSAALQAPQTLEDMVAAHAGATTGDEQGDCLASSVYYESKGEPLNGQLAVAQTVMNRTTSGRFPTTVCGVVSQPGQFSFLKGGSIPKPSHENSAWQRAVAIATIARQGLWKQIAPSALFFHARRVSPGWGKIRVASLGNHIFFR
jgi:spore germination cell wall hydrolase CwlJ-like protein